MIKVDPKVIDACTDSLKQFIQEFKKKAVYKSVLELREHRHHIDGKCYNVQVVDTRVDPPFVVGTIFVESGPDFVVCSERIRNDRYASYNGNYHTKRTKDIKKAVKTAVDYLRPFRWDEYAKQSRSEAEHLLRAWRIEPQSAMNRAADLGCKTILEEIVKHLEESDEPPFKTDAFNKAVKVVSENYKEAFRRQQSNYNAVFFHIDQQGRYINDLWPTPKFENEVPQEIMEKISLLKLVEPATDKDNMKKNMLDEVGVRSGQRDFWVFLTKEICEQLFPTKT